MRLFKRLWASLVFSSFSAFEHEHVSTQQTYVLVSPLHIRAEKEGCGGSQMMIFSRLFYLWTCATHVRSESNKGRATSSFSTEHYWSFDPLPITGWNWDLHLTKILCSCKTQQEISFLLPSLPILGNEGAIGKGTTAGCKRGYVALLVGRMGPKGARAQDWVWPGA